MRDGDHYVEYNDKNIEAEYMPSKEEDEDECFESLFGIGWYSYTGESDNKPQRQVGSEVKSMGEAAGDDEEPVVDAEDHNGSSDEEEGGAGSVDNAVLVAPSEVSWAEGCYHQMGSCGKLETGLRIRLHGCANNRTSKLSDPTNKEPELAWACQNKVFCVTVVLLHS